MGNQNPSVNPLLLLFIPFSLLPFLALSTDVITATQFLTGDQTLVSAGQEFELGFFPSGSSNDTWRVGIWYKNIQPRTIVWVANRDSPLRNSSGIMQICSTDGNLVILDGTGTHSVWSTNHSGWAKTAVIAQLLDNGNLIIRDDRIPGSYLWQSFDYPTDTLLPGMKLGWETKAGPNRIITSWKGPDNPSTGDYSFQLDASGFPEIYLMGKRGIYYRSGPWNGLRFSGVPEMNSSPIFSFIFVAGPNGTYYSFTQNEKSVYSRLLVDPTGLLQRLIWVPSTGIWSLFWYAPKDQCDWYRECGVYGLCDTNASPVCECLTGFRPKNPQAWSMRNGSDGCGRVGELDCATDGFAVMTDVKLPESGSAFVDRGMGLDECRGMCLGNCSCRGYSSANISGDGSGCVMWTEDLYDMRQYAASEGGQDFYFRVPAADLAQVPTQAQAPAPTQVPAQVQGSSPHRSSSSKAKEAAMISGTTSGILLSGLVVFFVWKRFRSKTRQGQVMDQRGPRDKSRDLVLSPPTNKSKGDTQSGQNAAEELDLPLFDLDTLIIATDRFSDANKLGKGGFGTVYKGVLEDQEIAVKRLSKTSVQGLDEFMNEVRLIARLQHRNLVRLLGCCIEIEEKMLVYEYMENKSLDSILFNKKKSSILNWQTRFNIICGIARGLLYLHQDSRFRIIHRDLKASNVLLDKKMIPKISDFGMARIFGGDQMEANTKVVVGTYGYMSPEYAMDGLFSVKSDVFSFGVLVLEIVSGTKNRGFYQTNDELNLLAYAWKLCRERKEIELIDSSVGEQYPANEVMRCILVGLLCVQEHAEDRPKMSNVVLMLSSDIISMPQPKHPGYCLRRRAEPESSPSRRDESQTVNEVTMTIMDGR